MKITELSKAAYPALWDVREPPDALYALARDEAALQILEELPHRGLAVVGTRRAQPRSLGLARSWVAALTHARLIVISGLARGIDAAAHLSALEARLPTIAVLGNGVDVEYPYENRELRARILREGGILVSEFPPGEKPRPGYFIQRNRLIAGWARATWVVQAPLRSGALSTANWALRHGRACFATPAFPGDLAFAGNLDLFEREVPAEPLWGPHSMETVWSELASLAPKRRTKAGEAELPFGSALPPRARDSDENADERALSLFVRSRTGESGGALVHDALNWAILRGWAPAQFFAALQSLLLRKTIIDRGGVLANL